MKGLVRSGAAGFTCIAAAWFAGAGLWASAAQPKAADAPPKTAPRQAAEEYVEGDVAVATTGGCCGRPAMMPVCRCKPTMKKTPKTEYEVKCELVCVPGCTRAGGGGCCEKPCGNATIRSKKTLLKKIVDEEKPAMEYEVEWVCANCVGGCSTGGCADEGCRGHGLLGRPSKAWHALRCFCRNLLHWK